MFPVIDHEFRHPAINADVLAGDEACLIRTEEQRHFRDVLRFADAPNRLLHGIRATNVRICRIDPSR